MSKALKISSKGQLVVPKEIRDKLPSNEVYMYYNENTNMIFMHVVDKSREVGGSLQKYAKKYIPMEEARKILEEKARNGEIDRY